MKRNVALKRWYVTASSIILRETCATCPSTKTTRGLKETAPRLLMVIATVMPISTSRGAATTPGFPPSTILKIDRKFSFPGPRRREEYVTNNWIATSEGMFALNKHATRYADDKQGLPSQKFHQTFALFMKAFEDKGFPTKFLEEEEEDSQLTTLYWDFIQNT